MVVRKARDQLHKLDEERLRTFLDLLARLSTAAATGEGFEELMAEAEEDGDVRDPDKQGEQGGTDSVDSMTTTATERGARQGRPGRSRSAVG